MATFKPVDDDLLDRAPGTEKGKKPAGCWFNWWQLDKIVGNLATGELLGPGRARETIPYSSLDHAETKAREWVEMHKAFGCQCGFGEHSYLGAYEEGKQPP